MTSNVTMVHGDLFSAPANSILIHSCNCIGSWRSGVALAFKTLYPSAHSFYVAHCAAHTSSPESLAGTCLLIPPQSGDPGPHWIACLFTSVRYGRQVDGPEVVLRNTEGALADLRTQTRDGRVGGEWHAAKINSVRFKVPWERTLGLLEGCGERVVCYEFEETQKA